MSKSRSRTKANGLELFHPLVKEWFLKNLGEPTAAQRDVWPAIARGENALLLAPTGSGKTLAAFLVAIDRLAFGAAPASPQPAPVPEPPVTRGTPKRARRPKTMPTPASALATTRSVRVLYISPLKALGADIARNLQRPIAGLSEMAAAQGVAFREPAVGIRSGDTPASERHRLVRVPPDVLITTPESLYLLLTSRAREILAGVETVIVDEIHSLVANKRGAHLFLSLERLETLRRTLNPAAPPLQRIGLSATQRPLEEVARLLGGAENDSTRPEGLVPRPVAIVAAGRRKELDLSIEMPMTPVSDAAPEDLESNDATNPVADAARGKSIWPAIHPRLVELIRSHRSTMLFVNNRRLAERLAAAINDLAGDEIALAHHGSIAKETRRAIEERLKEGTLPAIVATSSLELGIDMGAVELVIQIESPPSIAAGLQRIGRAGHQVGAASKGIVFPKFRGDLLACAAASARMMMGEVEETHFPRNPLDVLAQQIVAMVASTPLTVDALYATVRRAAPFHELPFSSFIGVLDLLAGRYPSDEFSELRPRVNWDRTTELITARRDSLRVAVANAGTIPDRGLYGVFLAGGERGATRVGELDEEMVFETAIGDVFLLGASSWRVLDITADRVLVAPAPGEPGRMPFWRGDGPGRPLEFGRAIGQLTRRLAFEPECDVTRLLTAEHGLRPLAAEQLVDYVRRQVAATVEPPSDETIVVESFRDEVGDWRVVVLTPFGSRVHAPWATAVLARIRQEWGGDPDVVWDDDGIALRISVADSPPPVEWLVPRADEVEAILVRELASTSLFAGRFRENAARALLLPRRFPGRRTPLWLQRRRSADLLHVAARFPDFPILLETYRECLRDVFDLPGLKAILGQVERGEIRVRSVETRAPSPFASTLLFGYAGNYLYNGDTPLAERRAHALALDHSQLRELLGEAELRELLDAESVWKHEQELQKLDGRFPPRDADDLHDLLLRLGDLSHDELVARACPSSEEWLSQLEQSRRALRVTIAGETRWIAVEDAARYRDALGIELVAGIPAVFLESVDDAWADLLGRYARTHGPFQVESPARRWGVGVATILAALRTLSARGRVVEGEFLPKGQGTEWCDVESLRGLRRKSLAAARRDIEPVDLPAYVRFLARWQGLDRPRRGLDGLLDVLEQLQGLALPLATWEQSVLPVRVADYRSSDLDELCAAGEVRWRGHGRHGARDGWIAFYLADALATLAPAPVPLASEPYETMRRLLRERGAMFFDDWARAIGGFRNDLFNAMWDLVWNGELTNDTLKPVRSLGTEPAKGRRGRAAERFRSRRIARTPGAEGRWSLLQPLTTVSPTETERLTSIAQQLLQRYGVVARETFDAEERAGGFAAHYPVFKAMEESGRARRGYFVAAWGPAQFALPAAEPLIRNRPKPEERAGSQAAHVLSALDPANPFGATIPWPSTREEDARPQRVEGARVIVHDGRALAYWHRSGVALSLFLEPHARDADADARRIVDTLASFGKKQTAVFLERIDGIPATESWLAARLIESGFVATSQGLLRRREEK